VGCIGRIGCLVVLLIGGAVGYWLYGDRVPSLVSQSVERTADGVSRAAEKVSERLDRPSSEEAEMGSTTGSTREPAVREGTAARSEGSRWVRLGSGVARSADPLRPFRASDAPAYVTLDAGQLAVVLAPLRAALPPSAGRAEIAIDDDRLLLRTIIARRDFAGSGALGALIGATLDGVDTLEFAGVFEPVRPGLSQYRIQSLSVGAIEIPSRLIPPIARKVRQVTDRAQRAKDSLATVTNVAGVADDALPVRLPPIVSDVRVVNGRATVYRNVVRRSR